MMKHVSDPPSAHRLPDSRPVWRGAVRNMVLSLFCTASAFAATPPLPASADPPVAEHHLGKFVFAELVTPDLADAKRFYGGLFGWHFNDSPEGGAARATLDGRPVAALAQRPIPPGGSRRPAWLRFIAVSDLDATRKTALANGARLLSMPPRDLSGHSRTAVFADPQGAVFGAISAPDGDPPDVLADPGEWIWCSLQTGNADEGASFYQKVFDYDVFEMPADGDRQHLLLASEDYARGSVNTEARTGSAAHPHWLHYVRVDDATASAARAVALGGQVLVEPRPDRQGGKVAVVADPEGAAIGLLEWPDGSDERAAAP